MEEKECSTCSQSFSTGQKGMLVLAIYILGSSIYGTVKIVDLISTLF
jgi:hypothetical protein